MRAPLTARQMEVFLYIGESIECHGRAPTVREIAAEFGINSPNGVMCHLDALERKGWITRGEPGAAYNAAIALADARKCPHCKGTGYVTDK